MSYNRKYNEKVSYQYNKQKGPLKTCVLLLLGTRDYIDCNPLDGHWVFL